MLTALLAAVLAGAAPWAPCDVDADCPADHSCARQQALLEKQCLPQCVADTDCQDAQASTPIGGAGLCQQGTCATSCSDTDLNEPACAANTVCVLSPGLAFGSCGHAAPGGDECNCDADCPKTASTDPRATVCVVMNDTRVCTLPCNFDAATSALCGAGSTCLNGPGGRRACVLDAFAPPTTCANDADCGAGHVCGGGVCGVDVDGTCGGVNAPQCACDVDCGAAKACVDGACVGGCSSSAVTTCGGQVCVLSAEAGVCETPPAAGGLPDAAVCASDGECASGSCALAFHLGGHRVCTRTCAADADCAASGAGYACGDDGACVLTRPTCPAPPVTTPAASCACVMSPFLGASPTRSLASCLAFAIVLARFSRRRSG